MGCRELEIQDYFHFVGTKPMPEKSHCGGCLSVYLEGGLGIGVEYDGSLTSYSFDVSFGPCCPKKREGTVSTYIVVSGAFVPGVGGEGQGMIDVDDGGSMTGVGVGGGRGRNEYFWDGRCRKNLLDKMLALVMVYS